MARIDFAWELGHSGHAGTLLPIAGALQRRGHEIRFLLRDLAAGLDDERAADFPREGAPHYAGPQRFDNPLNFGEVLHNSGYHDPRALKRLVDSWRERMWLSHAVIASAAPAAHIAARTLGIPSIEISPGLYVPPPLMPSPALRDWEQAPRAVMEQADRRVVDSVNAVLAAFGVRSIATIGELFTGRTLLATFPELDIYSGRGASEYYGVPDGVEGALAPPWPDGRGPRVIACLDGDYEELARLLDVLATLDAPTLLRCRNIDSALRRNSQQGPIVIANPPIAVEQALAQCDLVVCHGSHRITAQALLAGKPLLLLPTQLEQFLITCRVVRHGAALGVAADTTDVDFGAALLELSGDTAYAPRARDFCARYRSHDRAAALQLMIRHCEAALGAGALQPPGITSGQGSLSSAQS